MEALEFKKHMKQPIVIFELFPDWELIYLVNVFFKLKKLTRIVN